MSTEATPRPLSNLPATELVAEHIAHIKRTASIEPDANYLVGSLSVIVETMVMSFPECRELLECHVAYLRTQPSRTA